MTTSPTVQPGGVGPGQEKARDDADDQPRESDAHVTVIAVVLFLLLALGVRAVVTLNRIRAGNSDGKPSPSAPTPHSVIRIAAAPHSVVHVVSAPSLRRSHVQIPTRLAA
jgi:hypothetical protein